MRFVKYTLNLAGIRLVRLRQDIVRLEERGVWIGYTVIYCVNSI